MSVEDVMADVFHLWFGPSHQLQNHLPDRVLDTLDDAPIGHVEISDGPDYRGPLATIQTLAAALEMSDSAIRRAVHHLCDRGLVRMWVGLDPKSARRRLYVTAVVA